jgi:hypothetical protein
MTLPKQLLLENYNIITIHHIHSRNTINPQENKRPVIKGALLQSPTKSSSNACRFSKSNNTIQKHADYHLNGS